VAQVMDRYAVCKTPDRRFSSRSQGRDDKMDRCRRKVERRRLGCCACLTMSALVGSGLRGIDGLRIARLSDLGPPEEPSERTRIQTVERPTPAPQRVSLFQPDGRFSEA
jgi:hypothetical protein